MTVTKPKASDPKMPGALTERNTVLCIGKANKPFLGATVFLNLKEKGFLGCLFNMAKAAIGFRNTEPKEIFKVIS